MVYLTAIAIISLVISIVAVSVAIHTKLQRRESRELRELAQKLRNLQDITDEMKSELRDPRTNEDLDLALENIAREVLTCKHETDGEIVQIAALIGKAFADNSTEDENRIDKKEDLVELYKSGESVSIDLLVGNRDELYTTTRRVWLHNPIEYSSFVYDDLSEIKEEHGEKLEEFDSGLINEFVEHMNKMVEHSSENITDCGFDIDVARFDTTEEIGDYTFEKIFYYDGFEGDIQRLEELLDEIEELRKTVLQASYS